MQAPHFHNKTSEDLTDLDSACSGGCHPLASLQDAMFSDGFCPRCAPGWRLIVTPNADDPDFQDISIDAYGVVLSLLVGDTFTGAYNAVLDPEVDAAVEAALDRFANAMVEFRKRPVYTVPGDMTYHYPECPPLACRLDVREHLGRLVAELDEYDECTCRMCASYHPEFTCQL